MQQNDSTGIGCRHPTNGAAHRTGPAPEPDGSHVAVGSSAGCGSSVATRLKDAQSGGTKSIPEAAGQLVSVMSLAVGETVILMYPPLPPVGILVWVEMGRQQNDSLADG